MLHGAADDFGSEASQTAKEAARSFDGSFSGIAVATGIGAMSVREGWPTVDQYLARVLPLIPRQIALNPGSREFRAALRSVAKVTGILPTRTETTAAMHRLADRGIAPKARSGRPTTGGAT